MATSSLAAAQSSARKPAARAKAPSAPKKSKTAKSPEKTPEKPARGVASAPTGDASGVSRLVRNVRASDPASGVVLGNVTSLAVADNYLVLPLDFVSDVTLAKTNAKFYVDDLTGKVSQELSLIDLDLFAGIAVFKANNKIAPTLPASRLRENVPSPQEPLVSVSAVDITRGGAKFLRAKQDVSTIRYQIALGGVDHSPASYVFDKTGSLVAIAAGNERDGGVWAGSARSLATLIRKRSSPGPASTFQGMEPRRHQLFTWQDRWTQVMNPSKKGLSLRFLDCRPHHAMISEAGVARQLQRLEAKACESRFSMPLGGGYEAGVRIHMGEAFIKPSFQFSQNRDEALNQLAQAFSMDVFNDFSRSTASVNLLTAAECKETQAMNSSGQKVNVRFCTSALKGEAGLNDTSISVATLDPGWRGSGSHAYIAAVRLKGFGQTQTRRILEAMIEKPQEAR